MHIGRLIDEKRYQEVADATVMRRDFRPDPRKLRKVCEKWLSKYPVSLSDWPDDDVWIWLSNRFDDMRAGWKPDRSKHDDQIGLPAGTFHIGFLCLPEDLEMLYRLRCPEDETTD